MMKVIAKTKKKVCLIFLWNRTNKKPYIYFYQIHKLFSLKPIWIELQ